MSSADAVEEAAPAPSPGAAAPGQAAETWRAALERAPLRAALALNVALFALVYGAFRVYFRGNDDPMMMLLAAGVGRTASASPYLLFSNVLVGLALEGLYGLTLAVPWYPLYLIGGLFLAHTALLYVVLRRHGAPGLGLYLGWFVLAGVEGLLGLQFTIVGMTLALGGLALLFEAGREEPADERRGWRLAAAGAALVVLGSLVRFLSALLATGVAAPLLALTLLDALRGARPARRALAGYGAALLLSLLAHGLDRAACARDPGAAEFFRRNDPVTAVLDRGEDGWIPPEELERRIAAVGWSRNDFLMFRGWSLLNDEVFATERVQRFVADLPAWNRRLGWAGARAVVAGILAEAAVRRAGLALLLLAACVLWDRRALLAALATLGLILAALGALTLVQKSPPPRVYLPLAAWAALLPLLLGPPLLAPSRGARAAAPGGFARRVVAGVALCLGLLGGAAQVWDLAARSGRAAEVHAEHARALAALGADRGRLYLTWTGSLAWESMRPFAPLEPLRGLVALETRYYATTRATLAAFGVRDPYLALAQRRDVRAVIWRRNAPIALAAYRAFMREHYGLDVTLEPELETAFFGVYRAAPPR
ncbi:MAG: hypothetical protein AB7N76_17730 [Planctomycetota bacterium]